MNKELIKCKKCNKEVGQDFLDKDGICGRCKNFSICKNCNQEKYNSCMLENGICKDCDKTEKKKRIIFNPYISNNNMKTIQMSDKLLRAVKQSIKAALDYEKITGRKLGITGEVGEVLVCHKLGLNLLADDIATGFDAIDDKDKTHQIKTRRAKNGKGRLGSFSKHKYDYAILVELDYKYSIIEIWKVNYKTINPIVEAIPRRNPSLSKFKSVANRIY